MDKHLTPTQPIRLDDIEDLGDFGGDFALEFVLLPHTRGGVQMLFRFANGYGASMIRTPYSYGGDRGLAEIAVLRFTNKYDPDQGIEVAFKESCYITYDTPVTSDVEGYLDGAEALALLQQIRALPRWYWWFERIFAKQLNWYRRRGWIYKWRLRELVRKAAAKIKHSKEDTNEK